MEDPFHNTDGAYWTGVEIPQNGYNGRPIEPSNVAKSLSVGLSGFTGATSGKAYGLNIRAVVNPKETGINNVISGNGKVSLTYRNGSIHIFGNHPDGMVTIYDLSSRSIYSGSVMDGTCKLPKLSNGIYIVSIVNKGNTVTTQKITVK